jgi:hypothetical protein
MNTAVAPDRWGVVMVSSPYSARLPPNFGGGAPTLGHTELRVMKTVYRQEAANVATREGSLVE